MTIRTKNMIYTPPADIFSKEMNDTTLPFLGSWQKQEEFESGVTRYTEVELMEFHTDGTGAWTQFDNSGFIKPIVDKFNYRVQGNQIAFSFASLPEEYTVLNYRVVNGCLVLIENYGMPGDSMEVYTPYISKKTGKRKLKN